MAAANLTGAPSRVVPPASEPMSPADRAAHAAASHVRVTPEVQRAVTVYEVAAERYRELTGLDRAMTGADFDSLQLAQDRMTDARATLAAAGQLQLIEVA